MNIFACSSPPRTKEDDDEPPQVQPVKKPEANRQVKEASHKNKKARGLMKMFGL
jgi:hypothetical protein